MTDISTARVEPHERAKNEDFEFGFQSIIRNTAVLDRMLTSANIDYVAGGKMQAVVGTMTFTVDALWANGKAIDLPAFQSTTSSPILISTPVSYPRFSIVQVRGMMQSFDKQRRSFFEPELEMVQYHDIDTKNRLVAEIKIKHGKEGVMYAPETDSGYVKIAEIYIEPETTELTQENIRNVTAVYQNSENIQWTTEKTRTFRYINKFVDITSLTAATNSDEDTSTEAVSNTVEMVIQTIWNKIRSVVNKITSLEKSQNLEATLDTKAPANAALAEDTDAGTDVTTPAVASAPVASVLQTIWAKLRQVANYASILLARNATYATDNPDNFTTSLNLSFLPGVDPSNLYYVITLLWGEQTVNSSKAQIAIRYYGGNNIYTRWKYANNAWNAWSKVANMDAIGRLYSAGIVTLYQDNQQAELANLYGGTWLRVTSPAPRTLTAANGPSCSAGSSQFSGSTSANVPHSGAVKGSVVSIWFCANPGNWTGTLRSSTRGVLQSIKAGSDGRVVFNSVTLQDGEQLSVECPPPFTGYASWTAVNGNVSRTEYIYFRG